MRHRSLTGRMFLWGAALTFCGGLAAGTARADVIGVPLFPGTTTILPGEPVANLTNETLVATTSSGSLPASSPIKATLTSAVFRNSLGLLDFVFQLTNNGNSVPISAITLTNFGLPGGALSVNVLTGAPLPANAVSAGFSAATVGVPDPNSAQRSNGLGSDITFGFSVPPTTGALGPNQISNLFFIHTNATTFNQNGAGLAAAADPTNGGASFFNTFEPANAVPEPSMIAMAGVAGLFGLGYYRKHRARRVAD